MDYAADRWDPSTEYLNDGSPQIDNNKIENAIRPLALGQKNYLFAGSRETAQRAAVIHSFFAVCQKHEVNPFQWLKYTLENTIAINHKNQKELYPRNYKKMVQQSNTWFIGLIHSNHPPSIPLMVKLNDPLLYRIQQLPAHVLTKINKQ